jgi:ketosteroid isomerase-like protein
MTASVSSRRSFFLSAGLLAGAAVVTSHLIAQPPATDPGLFLQTYDEAWGRHDPHALALLHAEDVLVVNRFGSMVEGRAELEKVMAFLHGPEGPFHTVSFPRQELLVSRILNPYMATLHAKWKNPTMGHGDQLAHGSQMQWVDLISTYLLVRNGQTWQIVQHDLHSVDLIKFPFKTKWNT